MTTDPAPVIEWRMVPAGPFLMGSDPSGAYPPDTDEQPRHSVSLAAFQLSRIPVTNGQYRAFAAATGRRLPLAWPGAGARMRLRSPTSRGTTRRLSASGRARDFPPRRSGRLQRGAATIGSGRGETSRPTRPDASSPPGSAGRRVRAPTREGHRPPVRSTWPGTSGSGCRVPTGPTRTTPRMGVNSRTTLFRASCVAGRTLTAPTECAARLAGRCSLPLATPTSGSASFAPRPRPRVPFDWVDVPAGEAVLGRDPVTYLGEALADELPRASVELPSFELSLTPVTNAQYQRFVSTGACAAPAHWIDGMPPPGLEHHPVTWVDWFDAASVLLVGRRPAAERGRVGEGRPRDRRTPLPLGRRSMIPRAARWSAPASSTARRRPSESVPQARAHTGCSRCPGTSGSGSRAPTGRTRTTQPTAARIPTKAWSVSCAADRSPARALGWARCASRSRSHAVRRQCHIGFRVARDHPVNAA